MSDKKIILITIIILLVASNVLFGYKYFITRKQFQQSQASLETQKLNERVLDFAKLFIEKVLKAKTEVDFETRLKLENAVRDLNDEEILTQWQKFVDSKTESEAQDQVKNLMEMLVNKIKVQ